MPYDVLSHSPPGHQGRALRFDDDRELIPGNLAALGYRVAIVTASPPAYASTLIDLLNIDLERLRAGGSDTKEAKLRKLADYWGIDPADMCYVGDRYQPSNSEDSDAADAAGCEFIPAEDIDIFRRFPRITTNTSNHDTASRSTPDSSSGDRIPCPNRDCPNTASATLVRLGFHCPFCRTRFSTRPNARAVRTTGGRRAAESFRGLKDDPGRQDRRELQKQFLIAVPQMFRDCVIDRDLSEGRFQFPPWLLSRSEIRLDRELRTLAMKAAARLFPPLADRDGVHVDSLVPYRDEHKALMQKLKDFGTKAGGSGPEVHQSLGYFIALALAGHLSHDVVQDFGDEPHGVAVIPVPSHDLTEAHPGQFSLRLAARVAKFMEAKLLPVLNHGTGLSDISFNQGHGLFPENTWLEGFLEIDDYDGIYRILLDDQYTAGRSMKAAKESLAEDGWTVEKAMTWSQSMRHDEHKPSGCFLRAELGLSWNNCFCSYSADHRQ